MNANILQRLAVEGVQFVLVGAAAAIVRGAPVTTLDVDIVHNREPANLDRLHALLISLDAHYRGRPKSARLVPTREHLDTAGHILLRTVLGPLDILGAIEGGADYEALRARAEQVAVFGHSILVPPLEVLIELKRLGTRPEDPLKLRLLEETLRVQSSR